MNEELIIATSSVVRIGELLADICERLLGNQSFVKPLFEIQAQQREAYARLSNALLDAGAEHPQLRVALKKLQHAYLKQDGRLDGVMLRVSARSGTQKVTQRKSTR